MGTKYVLVFFATIILTSITPRAYAADFQAEVDLGNNELVQMIFKQIEMLGNRNKKHTHALTKDHTQLASALLQVAPVITIKGNITDPTSRLSVTFTIHASQHLDQHQHATGLASHSAANTYYKESGTDGFDDNNSLLSPVVQLMQPYVLGMVELVVNGILSTVIANFLEATTLTGDVRLV